MWREDDRVAAFDGEHANAGRRQLGVGRRHQGGNQSDRFGVLDDALLRQFLDHTDALLAQDVAQNAHHFEALANATLRVADAALLDAHVRETRERCLVGNRPRHGLAQTVDLRLRRVLEGRQSRPATAYEFVDVCGFFRCDGASCHGSPGDGRHVAHFHYFG